MNRIVRLAAATIAATALTVAGCGISPQTSPQPMPPPAGAALPHASPTTTPAPGPGPSSTGHAPEYLYFINNGVVVRVTRHLATPPSGTRLIKDLLAGPDSTETAYGYTSALLGDTIVSSIQITSKKAVVALASPVADTARNDEVLAYAQLVCTLTEISQISGVTFTNNGHSIAVPRGDGSLTQNLLTAADYTDLLAK